MAVSDIIVVGSANMDLVIAVDTLPTPGQTVLGGQFNTFPGGKGANQAVSAARAGGRVAMLGCVGNDAFGEALRAGLESEGVDTKRLMTVEQASGVALIATDKAGENLIAVAPGANGVVGKDCILPAYFSGCHIVLAQLETPLASILLAAEAARASGAVFILDPAPARALPENLMVMVDWITPNEGEARMLLGWPSDRAIDEDAAVALRALGARNVILKLGVRGAIVLEQGSAPVAVAAPAVDAVDTTAAGDAFNGAFAVALIEGKNAIDAVRFACAAASISVTRAGAQPSMAYRHEIDAVDR